MPRRLSLSSLKKKAWKLFSQYIRLKNADEGGTVECYTCGRLMHWEKDGAQAGHAIPGRHNAVLLDEDVVRVQCKVCNVFLRGNYPIFTTKLIKENGMEWWEQKLSDSRKAVKITGAEYQQIIDDLNAKIEELL